MSYLRHRYSPKVCDGGDLGRWYSAYISLQSLTREARREARLPQYVDLGIANCFATCILLMYHEAEFPSMRRYYDQTEVWRADVSEYYGVGRRQAKGVIARSLYGYPNPPTDFATSHVMPIVEWIDEDATRARDMICAGRPELLENFSRARRTSQRSTAFFYALSQKENNLLNIAPNEIPAKGPVRIPRIRERWGDRGRRGWGDGGFITCGIASRVGKFEGAE